MMFVAFSLFDWLSLHQGELMAYAGYALAVLLFVLGAVGCVLPYPGTLVTLGGCIVWALSRGEPYPSVWLWVALAALAVFGSFVDTVFSMLGAKHFGCSRSAFWCSALGMIIGAFFFPLGLLVGPFLGAFLGEWLLANRSVEDSAKSGAGALLGVLMGVGAKYVIFWLMLLLFFW